jgi:hypothetical protein
MTAAQYEVVSECSRTVIGIIASVKKDEKGGQSHTSASLSRDTAL